MDDLISRREAIELAEEIETKRLRGQIELTYASMIKGLQNLPSAQPERKKGEWVGKPIAGYCTVRCSVCKNVFSENNGRWNFCPHCGADMREEKADAEIH